MCSENGIRNACLGVIDLDNQTCCQHKHTTRPMNKSTYGGSTFKDTSECPVCNPKPEKKGGDGGLVIPPDSPPNNPDNINSWRLGFKAGAKAQQALDQKHELEVIKTIRAERSNYWKEMYDSKPGLEEVLAVINHLIGYKALTYSYIHAELTSLFALYPQKQQGPSLDECMAEVHKTLHPLSEWGIEIKLNLTKLFSEAGLKDD